MILLVIISSLVLLVVLLICLIFVMPVSLAVDTDKGWNSRSRPIIIPMPIATSREVRYCMGVSGYLEILNVDIGNFI